jgi:ATP-binding cassette subfamily F protein 3
MVTLSEVSLAFGDRVILDAVTFTLPKGRRFALYGANGSGKTTLMRVIVGELAPDSGGLHLDRDTRLAYLPQSGHSSALDSGRSLYEEAERAFERERRAADELARVEERLAAHGSESPEARRLLQRHQDLTDQLASSGYARRRERIERVLTGLGFARGDFGRSVGEFSQGWQMRIGLARVLCEQADILLLDEPTNYLDLEARTWLEQFLRETPAGVLVVSHDRYFLDTAAEAVAELYQGRLTLYPGTFSAYESRREAELAQTQEAYERQQQETARMEMFIRRFRYKASKARQVQSRIGQLERMRRIETPPVQKRIHFRFPDPPPGGRLALRLEELGKAYGPLRLFRGLDLDLSRGEKLALVGPNGAGKSTLMRILARQEPPTEGKVVYGSGLSQGYYSPDRIEELSGTQSVLELVEGWAPTHLIPQIRNLLGAFLFRDDEVFKPAGVLSGGEKSRLALLALLLHPVNCLFLDEPTNHLDLLSKDVLLDALVRYPGTLVFVSHDRYFIEQLATRVLELEGGRARVFPGDYAYYLWRKQRELEGEAPEAGPGVKPAQPVRPAQRVQPAQPMHPAQPAEPARTAADRQGAAGGARPAPEAPRSAQAARLQSKRLQSDLRRLAREEGLILAELEKLGRERSELESALADEEVYRDGARVKQLKAELDENNRRQEELTRRWEDVDREKQDLQ